MNDYPWIKLYPEILDDLKMRRLTSEQRWLWITVLCLANKSPVPGSLMITKSMPMSLLDVAESALLSSKDDQNLEQIVEDAFAKFEQLDMIKRDENGTVTVCNFMKRQGRKPSNAPEEVKKRVKKHRDKKKIEECNAPCNAVKRAETPLDIDKEEDKEVDLEINVAAPPEPQPIHHELTELLVKRIVVQQPSNRLSKKPYRDSAKRTWPSEFEKMIRLDARDPPEIREMIEWVTQHSFWASNVLSARKLREKWDQLKIVKTSEERSGKNKSIDQKIIQHWDEIDSFDPSKPSELSEFLQGFKADLVEHPELEAGQQRHPDPGLV
jgi:hypothetical protein